MKTKQSIDAIATDLLPPPGCAGSPIRRTTRSAPASVSLVTPEKIVANKRKDTGCSQHVASNHKKRKRGPFSSGLPSPRTTSFSACWAGNFELTMNDDPVQPHTLILGTHPSVASLSGNEYYAHPQNAFWWIAGDCLGFRRNTGISPKGVPYQISVELRQANNEDLRILPYRNQLATLVSHGFALWDAVASCERPGSLDSDIKDEIPNDVVSFCRAHPSIRRIVFSNGGTTARLFAKHFFGLAFYGLTCALRERSVSKGFRYACSLHAKHRRQQVRLDEQPSNHARSRTLSKPRGRTIYLQQEA
jgi:G:T/U-mismatch repair DNA glycosylase